MLGRHVRVTRKSYRGIVFFAVLPDILEYVPIVVWVAGGGPIAALYQFAIATPGAEPALPPIVQLLVHHLHCATHSAIVAGPVTLLVWLLRPRWLIPLLGWWSHIIFDVFTHSQDYYPSPVLYPITYRGFDGIAWNSPVFMLTNYLLLAALWLWLLRRDRRAAS